jgi:hypothetical protein
MHHLCTTTVLYAVSHICEKPATTTSDVDYRYGDTREGNTIRRVLVSDGKCLVVNVEWNLQAPRREVLVWFCIPVHTVCQSVMFSKFPMECSPTVYRFAVPSLRYVLYIGGSSHCGRRAVNLPQMCIILFTRCASMSTTEERIVVVCARVHQVAAVIDLALFGLGTGS